VGREGGQKVILRPLADSFGKKMFDQFGHKVQSVSRVHLVTLDLLWPPLSFPLHLDVMLLESPSSAAPFELKNDFGQLLIM
jgi:hypothetical protein